MGQILSPSPARFLLPLPLAGEGRGEGEPLSGAVRYPQVPSASNIRHSYVGQQVIGSVPVCLAHLHVGAGQGATAPFAVAGATHAGQ